MALEPIVGHTPGPWRVGEYDKRLPIISPHGERIAFMSGTAAMGPHVLADARLIAAAPEYHEAAKQRIARHDAQVRAHGGTECQDEFCNTFRPIVATAEGRES